MVLAPVCRGSFEFTRFRTPINCHLLLTIRHQIFCFWFLKEFCDGTFNSISHIDELKSTCCINRVHAFRKDFLSLVVSAIQSISKTILLNSFSIFRSWISVKALGSFLRYPMSIANYLITFPFRVHDLSELDARYIFKYFPFAKRLSCWSSQ